MLVSVKLPNGEEFARNKVKKVMLTSSSGEVNGVDSYYTDSEITEALAIINIDNVAAIGLAPDISVEDYQQLKAFEDELDLKLNAYENEN